MTKILTWVNGQKVLRDAYDGELAIPVVVPPVVSAFQARAALLNAGLLDDAEAAVAAAGGVVAIAWEYATEFRRDSPTIAALALTLGWPDALVDGLFIAAASITA